METHSEELKINYNSTNPQDVHADEEQDEVDYLRDENYYNEEQTLPLDDLPNTQMSQMSHFETQMSDETQLSDSETNQLHLSGSNSRSNEQNVIDPQPQVKKMSLLLVTMLPIFPRLSEFMASTNGLGVLVTT